MAGSLSTFVIAVAHSGAGPDIGGRGNDAKHERCSGPASTECLRSALRARHRVLGRGNARPLVDVVVRPMDATRSTSTAVLTTERLVLRDLCPDDQDWLTDYFSEPESQVNILRRQRDPRHVSALVRLSAKYASLVPLESRSYLNFAVSLRDTLTPIGLCGLSFVKKGSHRALLGWHFSNRFRGFGYAPEAARELMRIAFEERGVLRIVADCFESNGATIRVFDKLGMRRVQEPSIKRWLYALKYWEARPIVRYAIESSSLHPAELIVQ